MKNRPTIDDIADDPKALTGLPVELLADLLAEAKHRAALASTASRSIQAAVEARFADPIRDAYLAKGEDTGTVHIEADGFDVEVCRPKKVEWKQADLAALADKIRASGENPLQYLTISYGVDERKYTAWPDMIRAPFEAARTVKPGSVTVKLSRADSERAAA